MEGLPLVEKGKDAYLVAALDLGPQIGLGLLIFVRHNVADEIGRAAGDLLHLRRMWDGHG